MSDSKPAALSVAIVSINYAPEPTGIAVYTTGMARFLAAGGARVRVHAAFPYYPAWRKREEDRGRMFRREADGGVDLRRCYVYVPERPRALTRMIHEASFALSSAISYLAAPRCDVTIVVTPPLPAALPVLLLAKLKRSRTVVHVQDLQPDAAIDLGMLKPGLLTRVLFALEWATYRLADVVSTISLGMLRRIREKGVGRQRTFLLRNWADDDLVRPGDPDTALREEWELKGRFVVLYSGNLGVKQGLDMLIDCARLVAADPEVRFVIVGDGADRARLIERVSAEALSNVRFHPLQPKERLSELLATGDVSVIPQRAGVTDIVLPSKLGNILASARPVVVAAAPESDLAQIVTASGAGVVVAQGDAGAMAEAILRLKRDRDAARAMGANGHEYMKARLTRDAVMRELPAQLASLVADGRLPPAPSESGSTA